MNKFEKEAYLNSLNLSIDLVKTRLNEEDIKENPLSTAHYELRLTDLEHLRNLFQKLFMEGEK